MKESEQETIHYLTHLTIENEYYCNKCKRNILEHEVTNTMSEWYSDNTKRPFHKVSKKESELEKASIVNKYDVELKANQNSVHAIVTLLGKNKWQVKSLMEHLGVDDDKFDPDASCGSVSCRHCGACSGDGMEWLTLNKMVDDDGHYMKKGRVAMEDRSTDEYMYQISCHVCGEFWEQYLRDEV